MTYLEIPVQVKYVKAAVIHNLACHIESLPPDTCYICVSKYSVAKDEVPFPKCNVVDGGPCTLFAPVVGGTYLLCIERLVVLNRSRIRSTHTVFKSLNATDDWQDNGTGIFHQVAQHYRPGKK